MTVIRDAREGDAAGMAAVHVVSWQAAYQGLLPADVLAGLSVAARERMWAGIVGDPAPRSATLLATVDDTVVGLASIGESGDPGAGHDVGELYALYLHPDRWGRGLGRRLHAAAVERLAGLGFATATLWVLDGNDRALRFYRRGGWAADGHRKSDTGPGGVPLQEQRLHRSL